MTSRDFEAATRPGIRAVLRDGRVAAVLLCLLAWGIGTAGCWSKRASQPAAHARPEAG